VRVGFGLIAVPRQLDLEAALAVAQIQQREAGKFQSMLLLQAERVLVERGGTFQLHDSNHRMNKLRHGSSSRGSYSDSM
jgi:hypothetical protein